MCCVKISKMQVTGAGRSCYGFFAVKMGYNDAIVRMLSKNIYFACAQEKFAQVLYTLDTFSTSVTPSMPTCPSTVLWRNTRR